jgi:predicted  nucleic acid-binding Zn-ribbon protein
MLESDELTAGVKRAEAQLAEDQKTVDAERRKLADEVASEKAALERLRNERAELVAALDPRVLSTFELVSRRRNGVAVAEARDGICTICHVRIRPQVFNTVRRNDEIVQCDSCNRVLYFVAPAPSTTTT